MPGYSKEQQTQGYVPGSKKKQPINKVSAKKKFRCSDGSYVSQSYILNKLIKAYRSASPLTVCECCGLQPASDHDHTLAKEKCKQIGRTELIWDELNWSNSCRGCHNQWGYLSAAMEDHKNFVPRMLFLRQHDREEYMKRRNKISNYQILKQLPE